MKPDFKTNPKSQKAREKLMQLFSARERGDLVTHDDIEEATGFTRGDRHSAYYRIVQQVGRKHQDERGISIINQLLVGYSLATPEEQLKILPDKTKRAARQVRRGCGAVEALPESELTPHQVRLKDALLISGNDLVRSAMKSKQLDNYLMRSKPGEPLRIRREDKEEIA